MQRSHRRPRGAAAPGAAAQPRPVLDPLGPASLPLQGAVTGLGGGAQLWVTGGGGCCLTGVMTWMHLAVYE